MTQKNQAVERARRNDTRILEVDIAKAIGIICVFVGHRTWGSPVNRLIYLFHMSFFFILSGFMIRDERLTLKRIFSAELKLFASYLLYSLLFIAIDAIRAEAVPDRNIIHTLTLYGIDVLWFLSGLWLAKVFVRLIMRFRPAVQLILVFTVYSVCFFISPAVAKADDHGDLLRQALHLAARTFTRSGVLAIFVYLGWKLKDRILAFIMFLREEKLAVSVLSLAASFLSLLPLINVGSTNYHQLVNGTYIINIIAACCGTVLVLSIASVISRTTKPVSGFFGFVGRNSLHFMASEYCGFALFTDLFRKVLRIQNDGLLFTLYIMILCGAVYLAAPLFNKAVGRIKRRSSERSSFF